MKHEAQEVPDWLQSSGGTIRHGSPVSGEVVKKPEEKPEDSVERLAEKDTKDGR